MTNPVQPKPNPAARDPRLRHAERPRADAGLLVPGRRQGGRQGRRGGAEVFGDRVEHRRGQGSGRGAHEGVLKGSGGRMIVGSVSAEVYRRIEEHVRKAAGPRRVQAGERRSDGANPRQNKTRTPARRVRPRLDRLVQPRLRRRPTSRTAPPLERPFGSARGSLPPIGTRSASSRASGSPSSSGSTPASSRSSGSTARNIRRSRAGPRTSPFRIPSSASRASDARIGVPPNSMGRPAGRPSSFRACPDQARAIQPPPTSRD